MKEGAPARRGDTRVRLVAKIFAASLLPLLILIEVAGWSLNAVNRIVRTNRTIVTETLPALRNASVANELVSAMVRHHARWMVLHDPAYSALWVSRGNDLEHALAGLGDAGGSQPERRYLLKTRAAFRRYWTTASETVDGVRRLRPLPESQAKVVRRFAEHLSRSIRRLAMTIDVRAQRAQQQAASLEMRTWKTVLIALPASALLAVVLSFLVTARVTRVLRRLAVASTQVAQGSLTEPVAVNRNDELGDLARAFNAMAVRLGELDRMKEQVFSHLSHELRTPLTSVREATHLLADGVAGPLAPRQQRLVGIIGDSTDRLLRLVNRILDLSRLRAGIQPLEQRPVRLAAVAARALHELRPQAEAAGVRIDQTDDGADPIVLGDEERLVEVAVNLVSNAIKASPIGESIRVSVENGAHDAVFTVEDHGAGIHPDALKRIFDPYVQGPGARTGTGLGLAIVKGIVEAHRGDITVESEVGRGSRFAVKLRCLEGPA